MQHKPLKLVRVNDHPNPHELVARVEEVRSQLDEIAEQIGVTEEREARVRRIRSVIKARAQRIKFFKADLFADPAWEILLELYVTHLTFTRLSISSLCHACSVPATTALRWINKLEAEGLLIRCADPLDGRRVWIGLSDDGLSAMETYWASVSSAPL